MSPAEKMAAFKEAMRQERSERADIPEAQR